MSTTFDNFNKCNNNRAKFMKDGPVLLHRNDKIIQVNRKDEKLLRSLKVFEINQRRVCKIKNPNVVLRPCISSRNRTTQKQKRDAPFYPYDVNAVYSPFQNNNTRLAKSQPNFQTEKIQKSFLRNGGKRKIMDMYMQTKKACSLTNVDKVTDIHRNQSERREFNTRLIKQLILSINKNYRSINESNHSKNTSLPKFNFHHRSGFNTNIPSKPKKKSKEKITNKMMNATEGNYDAVFFDNICVTGKKLTLWKKLKYNLKSSTVTNRTSSETVCSKNLKNRRNEFGYKPTLSKTRKCHSYFSYPLHFETSAQNKWNITKKKTKEPLDCVVPFSNVIDKNTHSHEFRKVVDFGNKNEFQVNTEKNYRNTTCSNDHFKVWGSVTDSTTKKNIRDKNIVIQHIEFSSNMDRENEQMDKNNLNVCHKRSVRTQKIARPNDSCPCRLPTTIPCKPDDCCPSFCRLHKSNLDEFTYLPNPSLTEIDDILTNKIESKPNEILKHNECAVRKQITKSGNEINLLQSTQLKSNFTNTHDITAVETNALQKTSILKSCLLRNKKRNTKHTHMLSCRNKFCDRSVNTINLKFHRNTCKGTTVKTKCEKERSTQAAVKTDRKCSCDFPTKKPCDLNNCCSFCCKMRRKRHNKGLHCNLTSAKHLTWKSDFDENQLRTVKSSHNVNMGNTCKINSCKSTKQYRSKCTVTVSDQNLKRTRPKHNTCGRTYDVCKQCGDGPRQPPKFTCKQDKSDKLSKGICIKSKPYSPRFMLCNHHKGSSKRNNLPKCVKAKTTCKSITCNLCSLKPPCHQKASCNLTNAFFSSRKKCDKYRKCKKRKYERVYDCDELYMKSLRQRPLAYLYELYPGLYPHCLSFLVCMKNALHVSLFSLAFCVWTPCLIATECCRLLFLCCFCPD